MENYDLRYGEDRYAVAAAPADTRAAFIRKTYAHVAGAVLAFVALEAAAFKSGFADSIASAFFTVPYAGLLLMVTFIGGGYAAQYMARSATSNVTRYLGFAMYIGLWAVLCLPLIWKAENAFSGQYVAAQAGIVTLAAFAGLTLAVFVSGQNFSFLGPVLGLLSFAALGVIVASIIFGFSLGILFVIMMIMLAGGYIIYDTSNVIHVYREDQYVAAALELFADVALMFWYILQLFMSLGNRD